MRRVRAVGYPSIFVRVLVCVLVCVFIDHALGAANGRYGQSVLVTNQKENIGGNSVGERSLVTFFSSCSSLFNSARLGFFGVP